MPCQSDAVRCTACLTVRCSAPRAGWVEDAGPHRSTMTSRARSLGIAPERFRYRVRAAEHTLASANAAVNIACAESQRVRAEQSRFAAEGEWARASSACKKPGPRRVTGWRERRRAHFHWRLTVTWASFTRQLRTSGSLAPLAIEVTFTPVSAYAQEHGTIRAGSVG